MSLSLCFVVFSISFEKRNSAAAVLVELVFLVLYLFVQIPRQTSLFPSILPRCPVTSLLQTMQQLLCSCVRPYCLPSAAKKESVHLIDFHLGGVANFSHFNLADTLITTTFMKIILEISVTSETSVKFC